FTRIDGSIITNCVLFGMRLSAYFTGFWYNGLRNLRVSRFIIEHRPTSNTEHHMDIILINGLEFYAYHGASDPEQAVGHRYRVDAELSVDTRLAGQTDELGDTVSYSRVAKRLMQIGTEQQYRLLEALAAQMTEVIFAEFAMVDAVKLRVQKMC